MYLLQLPLTPANTAGKQYISYTVPARPKSLNPVFNLTFPVSSNFFDENSYLAVELYNRTVGDNYIGGVFHTVADWKTLSHHTYFVVSNPSNSSAYETIDTYWSTPN